MGDWLLVLIGLGSYIFYLAMRRLLPAWIVDLAYLVVSVYGGLYDAFTGASVIARLIDAAGILVWCWFLYLDWHKRKRRRAPRLAGYKARAIQARLKAALNPT